ncbi:unnamed protein product [Durusdinium trenchii]|uniref:C2H2-type domain-containing protein n=1 Tax=Durusdinium trenchii TaxID=1381693 RepID=A0ABP0MVM4_9DINO
MRDKVGASHACQASAEPLQRPGPVTVFAAQPGPVTLLQPSPSSPQPNAPVSASVPLSTAPMPAVMPEGLDWICEVCMRKFSSEEALRKHEQLSELHKQNLMKLGT